MTLYEQAKAKYAALGIDVEAAMDKLAKAPVSLHCWQGDDVRGFDTDPNKPLTGGIQTTGNYPGRATTPDELRDDIRFAKSMIPGAVNLNMHACYAEKNGKKIKKVGEMEMPGFFSIFNENMVCTAILMTVFFGIIMAIIGKPYFVEAGNLTESTNFVWWCFDKSLNLSLIHI